jgi:ligand-binding sensor domain-containing protein
VGSTGRALLAVIALTAPADARVVFTSTDEVRACLPLPGGDTLAGTAGGLVRLDPAGLPLRVWTASDGLPGTRIDALIADGERVWVGTDGGVAELAGDVSHAVATRPVRDIARWQGTTYLATWDGGVIALGPAPGTLRGAIAMRGGPAAQRLRASSLAVAGGTLWAGTAAGLYQMRNGTLERSDGPRDVTALVADGATLWIGSSEGLWIRDDRGVRALGGGEVRRLALVDGAIVAAGADGLTTVDRGRVIPLAGSPRGFAQAIGGAAGAACTGGLDGLWTRARGAWHHAPQAGGPPSSDISAVVADGARLWVGSFDQGLASYDPDRGWQRIAGPGAPDARINALVLEPRPDGARLWVATAEGIQVLDATGRTIRRLGRGDGLPSRSVLSIARLSDGRIIAGTSVGAAFVGDGGIQRVGPRGLGDRGIGNVWAIAETSAGLWLGTTTGLYRGPATPWTSKDGSDDEAAVADRWQRLSVAGGQLRDDWVTALVTRGDVVWAGTYNGGVARIDGDTATPLGGGWVNPSGLVWDGDHLLAATMDGLVTGDGRTPAWTATPGLPGRDVTAAVRTGKTLWIATRRGLIGLD